MQPALSRPPQAAPSPVESGETNTDPRAADIAAFGEEIERIRLDVESRLGDEDVRHVKRMRRVSRASEVVGRALIHFSPEPFSFGLGVLVLWLHKQLEATEIGHTALHGAFDKLEGAEAFRSKSFRWQVPIDEQLWHRGHNIRHHQYTNIAGRDPDTLYGPVRLSEHVPEQSARYPLLATLGVWSTFGFVMNLHFAGLDDLYLRRSAEHSPTLEDRSWRSIRDAHVAVLRKYLPYYAYNFVLFPALAGPMFWKVLLGNVLAEWMRDVYSAATIYCGHIGEDVRMHPEGTRVHGKAAWYVHQAEAAQNFEVPLPVSILCGALDRQIEHHLFPRFPTNRLREVAPRVRAACERHGIRYNTGSWGQVLRGAARQLHALRPGAVRTAT